MLRLTLSDEEETPSDAEDVKVTQPSSSSSRKYTIPKRRTEAKELLQPIELDSRDFVDEIYPTIKQSWYDAKRSECRFQFSECQLINNPELNRRFDEKKREMTKMFQEKENPKAKIYNEKELAVTPGFLHVFSDAEVQSIAQEGLCVGHSTLSYLGKPEMGVYLSRFSDILTSAPLTPGVSSGTFIIFKTLKGRVKAVSGSMEPTPSYDCHVGKEMTSQIINRSAHELFQALQAYYYEYNNENGELMDCPRTVLPYAVVKFQYEEPDGNEPVAATKQQQQQQSIQSAKALQLWAGSLKCGPTISIHGVQLMANYSTLKPYGLAKNISIKKLVSFETVANWTPIKQLTEPANNGQICRKREVKLNDTEFVSYYKLSGLRPESMSQLSDLSQKLLQSKAVGLAGIRGGTTIIIVPNSEFSTQLGIPSPKDGEKMLHCIFISYRSVAGAKDSNSLFDHHQPIQSVALAGVQLNFDRLVGMFRVAFGKKYTKPVESMEARVSEILVDPYVLEENVSHEDVPRESSSPVGLESPDSSSEDIFSTPKFPHQTGLRSSLPIPPTIPTETEDLGNDNDEDEMMKIITRPTALGGSLLTAPVIPFGQVQPVIEEDDGDRPYDPGEEDGRTNSNFSYLDLNSVKSLNSDNLNRIRSYSELIRDRGDTATEVSFMSSNGVSDTPSSPVHEGTEDTAGPCGANPVILPLEDRRFDGTQDVDLRRMPSTSARMDVDERTSQPGGYCLPTTSGNQDQNKRKNTDELSGTSDKRPRSSTGLLPLPPGFGTKDVDMRRQQISPAVVLPIPKIFNVPPPPVDFSAPPPGYPIVRTEGNSSSTINSPNVAECQPFQSTTRAGPVRDSEVLGVGGVQEAIVSSTTPDQSVCAGQVGPVGVGEAEIEANSKLSEAQKYQQILTEIRSKVLDWLSKCSEEPLLPTSLSQEEIRADPRLNWDLEEADDELMSQASDEYKRQNIGSSAVKIVKNSVDQRVNRHEETLPHVVNELRQSWIPTEALKDHTMAETYQAEKDLLKSDSMRPCRLRSSCIREKLAVEDQSEDMEPMPAIYEQIIYGTAPKPSLMSLIPPVVVDCLRESSPKPTDLAIESLNRMVENTNPMENSELEKSPVPQAEFDEPVEFSQLLEDYDDESLTLSSQMRWAQQKNVTEKRRIEANADENSQVGCGVEEMIEFRLAESSLNRAFSEISQANGPEEGETSEEQGMNSTLLMETPSVQKPSSDSLLVEKNAYNTITEKIFTEQSIALVPVEVPNTEAIWTEGVFELAGNAGASGTKSIASTDAPDVETFGSNSGASKQQCRQLILPAKLLKSTLPNQSVEEEENSIETTMELYSIPLPKGIALPATTEENLKLLNVRCEEIPLPPDGNNSGSQADSQYDRNVAERSFSPVSSAMSDESRIAVVAEESDSPTEELVEEMDEEVLDVGCNESDHIDMISPSTPLDYDEIMSTVDETASTDLRKEEQIDTEDPIVPKETLDVKKAENDLTTVTIKTVILQEFTDDLNNIADQMCQSYKDGFINREVPIFPQMSTNLSGVLSGFKQKIDSTLSCCQKLEEQKFRKSTQDVVKNLQADEFDFDVVFNAVLRVFSTEIQSYPNRNINEMNEVPLKRSGKKLKKKLRKLSERIADELRDESEGFFLRQSDDDESSGSEIEMNVKSRQVETLTNHNPSDNEEDQLVEEMSVTEEQHEVWSSDEESHDIVYSYLRPLDPDRYEIPFETLNETTREVVRAMENIRQELVESFSQQLDDPLLTGPFQWTTMAKSSDQPRIPNGHVESQEICSSGVLIPDDMVLTRANPEDFKKILKTFLEWKQSGKADWHLKLHSQVALKLSEMKRNLQPDSPQWQRVSELISLLAQFRQSNIVRLMEKHSCDRSPRPTLDYLPCVQKIKDEVDRWVSCVMLTNLSPDSANAAGFHLSDIEVMSITTFMEKVINPLDQP